MNGKPESGTTFIFAFGERFFVRQRLLLKMPRGILAATAQRLPAIIDLSRCAQALKYRWREIERLDSVFWIAGRPPVPLAIVLCPCGGKILKDELREIARSGVQVLVSMLEPDEADWLGLGEEGPLAERMGMRFLSYPIQDVSVPGKMATFREFVSGLADRLRGGERVGLHCRGSIGRAPLTAACTLIHLGWKAKDALAAIEAARGYPIPDTKEQLRWILNYKAQP